MKTASVAFLIYAILASCASATGGPTGSTSDKPDVVSVSPVCESILLVEFREGRVD